jgi:hypothetical protein
MAETATQGIKLTLKTGEVIDAPNYEEALKIAVGMAENTKDVYKEEKAKREALEQRIASIEAATAAANRPKPTEGAFNQEKYYELLNRNAVEAANYVDAHRFGINDPNSVPQVFQSMQRDISVTRQEAMGAAFLQQHAKDFPQTPESTAELMKSFKEYIGQGYPATVETLNLAYGQAVTQGHIKPLDQKEAQERQEPNPSLSGSGASGIDAAEMNKVESMSDKELEALLRSKGLL